MLMRMLKSGEVRCRIGAIAEESVSTMGGIRAKIHMRTTKKKKEQQKRVAMDGCYIAPFLLFGC